MEATSLFGAAAPVEVKLKEVSFDVATNALASAPHRSDVEFPKASVSQFLGFLYLGSTRQRVPLRFDSTLAQSWFYSSPACKNDDACAKVPFASYDPARSASYSRLDPVEQRLAYRDGSSLSGLHSRDKLCYLRSSEGCLADFDFLLGTRSSDGPLHQLSQSSGVVALGRSGQEGGLLGRVGVFGLYISQAKYRHSVLTVGSFDLERYASKKPGAGVGVWIPQDPQSELWEVKAGAISLGEKALFAQRTMVVDTSSSFSFMPKGDFDLFVQTLSSEFGVVLKHLPPSQPTHYFLSLGEGSSDDALESLPELAFSLETDTPGQELELKAASKDYLIETETADEFLLTFMPDEAQSSGQQRWRLGLQVLRNYYTVFDSQNQRLGLVESAEKAGLLNWEPVIRVLLALLAGLTILLLLICCLCKPFRTCCLKRVCRRKRAESVQQDLRSTQVTKEENYMLNSVVWLP